MSLYNAIHLLNYIISENELKVILQFEKRSWYNLTDDRMKFCRFRVLGVNNFTF